jgi:DNA polymerase-3 subunit gamma/tau
MAYVAFARKYRPRSFDEVVGQDAIARALAGAVKSQRTATAYLFSGSHGVGKTSMARILAKALNCPQADDGRPCLECETCAAIDRGGSVDVIEIDAASNRSVEDAERIRQAVRYKPQSARYKVYILDEVHQLSKQAFDALLKTFEEAPDHIRFILATTELHKVPSTIKSRAQVFEFRRSTRADLEKRLQQIAEGEGVEVTPEALSLVSRRARGSMRDGQKLLDQVVTLGAGTEGRVTPEVVIRLLGALSDDRVLRVLSGIAQGDAKVLLEEVSGYLAQGGRAGGFLEELQGALRAVLYLKACGKDSPLLEEFPYRVDDLLPAAEALSEEAVLFSLQLLEEAGQKLRTARESRVVVEVTLVRLARAKELRPIGEVLARLERLEQSLGGGGAPAPSQAPPQRASAPARGGRRDGGSPSSRQGSRRSYDYPGRDAPAQPAASPQRAMAELDRAQRHPSPPPTAAAAREPAPAASPSRQATVTAPPEQAPAAPRPSGGPLDATRLGEAWTAIQHNLGDSLGMVASVLDKGKARVRIEKGHVRLEVGGLSDMLWQRLDQPQNAEVLADELGAQLGQAVKVEFARVSGPEAAPSPGRGPSKRGGGSGSVYDEEIVKMTQRELASQPMMGD